MKKFISIACALMICAVVHAGPATEASIEKLLTVTGVEKGFSTIQDQVNDSLKSALDQAFKGKNLDANGQMKLDALRVKVAASLSEELTWAKMRDLYVQVYTESFTQEEVDAQIAFYESPVGKSIAAKMPSVMQRSMVVLQERMAPMMQKTQQLIVDGMKDIAASQSK